VEEVKVTLDDNKFVRDVYCSRVSHLLQYFVHVHCQRWPWPGGIATTLAFIFEWLHDFMMIRYSSWKSTRSRINDYVSPPMSKLQSNRHKLPLSEGTINSLLSNEGHHYGPKTELLDYGLTHMDSMSTALPTRH
jgi:hypothetical protein